MKSVFYLHNVFHGINVMLSTFRKSQWFCAPVKYWITNFFLDPFYIGT